MAIAGGVYYTDGDDAGVNRLTVQVKAALSRRFHDAGGCRAGCMDLRSDLSSPTLHVPAHLPSRFAGRVGERMSGLGFTDV